MFRNNKHSETSQRFSIKKYSFGVASALVGVFFAAGANYAQADNSTTQTTATPVVSVAQTPAPAAPVATPATQAQTPAAPVVQTTTQATSTSAPVAQTTTPAPNAATTTANPTAQKEADKKAEEKTKAEVKAAQTRVTPKWTANTVTEITAEIKRQEKEELKEYVVQWGDTLNRISKATGTSVADLVRYNNIKNPNKIFVGDLLKNVLYVTPSNLDPRNQTDPRNRGQQNGRRSWIANSVEEIRNEIDAQTKANNANYVIKWGDTLSRISKASGKSIQELKDLNKIANINKIYAGKELKGVIVPTNTYNNPGQNNGNNNQNDPGQSNNGGNNNHNIPTPVEEKYVVVSGYAYNSLDNIIDEGEFTLSDGENSQKITLNYETEGYHYYHILTGKTYTLSGTDFEVTLTAKDENQVDIVNKVGKFTKGYEYNAVDNTSSIKFKPSAVVISNLVNYDINDDFTNVKLQGKYDLKQGNNLILPISEKLFSGGAFEVISSTINGDSTELVVKNIDMLTLVEDLKINGEFDLNNAKIVPAEGVQFISKQAPEVSGFRSNENNLTSGMFKLEHQGMELNVELNSKLISDFSIYDLSKFKFSNQNEVNLEFVLGGRNIDTSKLDDKIKQFNAKLKERRTNNLAPQTISYVTDLTRIPIMVPINPYSAITFTPFIDVSVEGGAHVQFNRKFILDLGVEYNDTITPINTNNTLEHRLFGDLEGEAKGGFGGRVGIAVGVLRNNTNILGLSGKFGVGTKGNVALNIADLSKAKAESIAGEIEVYMYGDISGAVLPDKKNADGTPKYNISLINGEYTLFKHPKEENNSQIDFSSLAGKYYNPYTELELKEDGSLLINGIKTEIEKVERDGNVILLNEKPNTKIGGVLYHNQFKIYPKGEPSGHGDEKGTSNNRIVVSNTGGGPTAFYESGDRFNVIDYSQIKGKYINKRNGAVLEIKEDGSLFVNNEKIDIFNVAKEGDAVRFRSEKPYPSEYSFIPAGKPSHYPGEGDILGRRILAKDPISPGALYYRDEDYVTSI